jgi:hypothetical protein
LLSGPHHDELAHHASVFVAEHMAVEHVRPPAPGLVSPMVRGQRGALLTALVTVQAGAICWPPNY